MNFTIRTLVSYQYTSCVEATSEQEAIEKLKGGFDNSIFTYRQVIPISVSVVFSKESSDREVQVVKRKSQELCEYKIAEKVK